jgi:hypothetical protein
VTKVIDMLLNDEFRVLSNVYREIGQLFPMLKKIMPFRWQAGWAKMTSHGGKLTALVCHPTKNVNKAE